MPCELLALKLSVGKENLKLISSKKHYKTNRNSKTESIKKSFNLEILMKINSILLIIFLLLIMPVQESRASLWQVFGHAAGRYADISREEREHEQALRRIKAEYDARQKYQEELYKRQMELLNQPSNVKTDSEEKYLVDINGKYYGPADIELLKKWKNENRLNDSTRIIDIKLNQETTVGNLFKKYSPAVLPPPVIQDYNKDKYVVVIDGKYYGPADIELLKKWKNENRLNNFEKIINAQTNKEVKISDLFKEDFDFLNKSNSNYTIESQEYDALPKYCIVINNEKFGPFNVEELEKWKEKSLITDSTEIKNNQTGEKLIVGDLFKNKASISNHKTQENKQINYSINKNIKVYISKINEQNDNILKLQNGAILELTSGYLGYIGYNKSCILFNEGHQWKIWIEGKKTYKCNLLKTVSIGSYKNAELKYLSQVINGKILKMLDGSLYEVSSLYTIHTNLWLGLSDVLIIDNIQLVNLDEGAEIIGVKRIK